MKYNHFAKVFVFLILFLITLGLTEIISLLVLGIPLDQITSSGFEMSLSENVVTQALSVIAMLALVSLFFKIGDNYNYLKTSLSIKGQKNQIIKSTYVTIGMIGTGFLMIWGLGWIEISTSSISLADFLLVALLFISVSIVEEVVVRGYILHTLMKGMNKYVALFVSSTIFSLMHLANPNSTMLGFINLWLAGLFLGIVYVHTKNLWFALTAHFIWNFMQSPVLGFNVSGNELPALLKIQYLSHDTWTGGEFGFEGSVICTIISVMAIILLDYHYRNKTKQVAMESI